MKPQQNKKRYLNLLSYFIIYIITILYFTYASYISIASLTARAYVGEDLLIASRSAFNLFLSFLYEYIVYSVLMLINYILYKKQHKIPLLIINSIIFLILIIDFTTAFLYHEQPIDLLLFVISTIYGFKYTYNLFKLKTS